LEIQHKVNRTAHKKKVSKGKRPNQCKSNSDETKQKKLKQTQIKINQLMPTEMFIIIIIMGFIVLWGKIHKYDVFWEEVVQQGLYTGLYLHQQIYKSQVINPFKDNFVRVFSAKLRYCSNLQKQNSYILCNSGLLEKRCGLDR
jgi:hypothetical protein